MAKFERLEPRAEDMPVFDGGIDEEDAEEGSRLPLLIVIALLVLAAFAGVVWLAYTQGVERGRSDAPRIIVAQGGAGATKLKLYQQPAPADEETTDTDSAPPPPSPAPKIEAPPTVQQQVTPTLRPGATSSALMAAPKPPAAETTAVASAVPPHVGRPLPRIATHAPAQLAARPTGELPPTAAAVPAPAPATPAGAAPAVAEPEKPAESVTGGYMLQIGSYKSQDEAGTAWREFQSRHAIGGGYESSIKQVDLGEKGTWFRLRIGSFADKDAAIAFCAKLKADGANCLLAR